MKTLNFAHRGFSGEYPENTMLAFRRAIEAGADGIELDVHQTKDGRLAVIHDEDVRRTTDGAGLVGACTLDELRALNASAAWGGKHPPERIPTLEEYLDLAKEAGILTNIELKNGVIWYEGMEEKVIALVRARGMEDKVIFSSFNHYSIRKCLRLAPEIPCGFLCDCWVLEAGAYTRQHGAQFYHPQVRSLTDEALAEADAAGIGVNTWTVNDEDVMRRLKGRVNAMIGNFPDRMRAVLNEA